jgi:hypothetical protein
MSVYYLFEDGMSSHGKHHVSAKLLTPIRYDDYEPPHWWDGERLTKRLPHLQYGVTPIRPLPDAYNTGWYELYSRRLIKILRDAGVRFELFPATLVDEHSRETLGDEYAVFHLLQKLPVFGREQERLANPTPMFRVAEARHKICIHHHIAVMLDRMDIIGCFYEPVELHKLL